jgi:hypothetical protein
LKDYRAEAFVLFRLRNAQLVLDPNMHNNKLATFHSYFATPFSRNGRMPTIVPWYLAS